MAFYLSAVSRLLCLLWILYTFGSGPLIPMLLVCRSLPRNVRRILVSTYIVLSPVATLLVFSAGGTIVLSVRMPILNLGRLPVAAWVLLSPAWILLERHLGVRISAPALGLAKISLVNVLWVLLLLRLRRLETTGRLILLAPLRSIVTVLVGALMFRTLGCGVMI